MSEFSFDAIDWIGAACGEEAARATLGSLRITAGEGLKVAITEVEDTLAQSVRLHINVPLVSVAEWLVMNWWRLRWEGKPTHPTTEWYQAHCLSGIGGDDAWPPLELSSDGEFIQLRMEAEAATDVSAIRYLRSVSLEVPVSDFEAAIERFVDVVEARLALHLPKYRALSELRAELGDERRRASVATTCRWQALAGIDPGDATEAWLEAAQSLVEEVGATAGDEVMSVVPDLDHDLASAKRIVEAMKQSTTTVDLSGAALDASPAAGELPWQRGARLAREMRRRHGLGTDVLTSETLSELLSTHLPLRGEPATGALSGGFRNGVAGGRTKIIWKSRRPETQRFYLARMIGAAHVLAPDQHLVPVTERGTALQKLERSFAQEFLCPWAALNAFTDEHGLDDEALVDAAQHFQVSEYVVRSTLVNRGKVPRTRLPQG